MQITLTADHILSFLLAAIPALVNIGLAAYVFIRLPQRSLTNVFSLVLLSSAIWQASAAMMRLSDDRHTALIFDNILAPSGLFTAPFILHFALYFCDLGSSRRKSLLIGLAYLFTFIIAAMYPMFNSVGSYYHSDFWGWINTRQHGAYSIILGVYLLSIYFFTICILLRELFRTSKGSNKYYQLLLISLPYLLVIVQATITESLFPIVFKLPPFPVTPTVMILFSITSSIALTRYHLFQGMKDVKKDEILSNISDVVLVVDHNQEISYINKPGCRALGYKSSQILGRQLEKILQCAETGEDFKELFALGRTKLPFAHKCALISKQRDEISVLVTISPMLFNGRAEGLMLVCRNMTEVEKAQEEMQRSERRFEKILERSKDAVALINEEGVIVYATQSIRNVIGYEPGEVVSKNFSKFIHPDSLTEAAAVFNENLHAGKPLKNENVYKAINKKGQEIWIEAVGVNQLDDPDIHAVISVFRDVTEKYNINRERVRSLTLFEALIRVINATVIEDEQRRIFSVNQAFCEMFSIPLPPAALIGTNLAEAAEQLKFLMREPELFAKRIEDIIARRQNVLGEIIHFADGRIFERDYFPIISADGTFMGHLWRYSDITQRSQMEQELIEKNQFMELAQEIGQMGSWTVELTGDNSAWWSKGTLRIFGLEEKEFDGKSSTYFSFVHPDDIQMANKVWQQALEKREPFFSMENRIVLRDGTQKWVYSRAETEYENGTPVRIIGIVQDISWRKQAENDMLEQNQELTKINAELDKFVYSASHDIRSPLMSILGVVNLALEELPEPGAQLYLQMVRDRVLKLDDFVLDIIHYSRNARTEVQKDEICVKELVEEVIETLKYRAGREVLFKLNMQSDLRVYHDRLRLSVVLSNLISNAIKYQSGERQPMVDIEAEQIDGKLAIKVADNGEGMAEQNIHRIFDMFTRLSERSTGSGLGLYIVKEVMEKLHGEIKVDSRLGEGSVFSLKIPLE